MAVASPGGVAAAAWRYKDRPRPFIKKSRVAGRRPSVLYNFDRYGRQRMPSDCPDGLSIQVHQTRVCAPNAAWNAFGGNFLDSPQRTESI